MGTVVVVASLPVVVVSGAPDVEVCDVVVVELRLVVLVVVTAAARPPNAARANAMTPASTNNRRIAVLLALCLCIVAGMVGYLV